MNKCAFALRSCIIVLALLLVGFSSAAQASIPEGFKVFPLPDQLETAEKPVIKVRYPKGLAMMYGVARLWINDKEVSSNCVRTPYYISYQPFKEIAPGNVSVRFEGKTLAKKQPVKIEWSFELKGTDPIKSVTHNCDHEMFYLEQVVVQAEATPGAQVWFGLEGVTDNVPMIEDLPGKYEGRYTVKLSDNKLKSHLTVHMKQGAREYSRTLDKTVAICGSMFAIIIDEPKSNQVVPLQFKIKGHTRPNATIYMQPRIGMGGVTAPTNDRGAASLGTIPCEADDKGYFEMDYGFPIKLPSMQASLTFTGVDREGNEAMIKQVWVIFE